MAQHTDTRMHPHTFVEHVLHTCAHMHAYARVHIHVCAYMRLRPAHVRAHRCIHTRACAHVHDGPSQRGRERKRTANVRQTGHTRTQRRTQRDQRGAGDGGPGAGSRRRRPLCPTARGLPTSGGCTQPAAHRCPPRAVSAQGAASTLRGRPGGEGSCLDCRFLMRDSMSRWPAEYCSITSITSYGRRLSLNFRLDTRNRMTLERAAGAVSLGRDHKGSLHGHLLRPAPLLCKRPPDDLSLPSGPPSRLVHLATLGPGCAQDRGPPGKAQQDSFWLHYSLGRPALGMQGPREPRGAGRKGCWPLGVP